MNCSQARTLLAAYRELKESQADTTALDVHLAQCAACRQILNQYNLTGEHVRSIPLIEPPPDAHAKLMQALASEHARFIQHSSSATPPTPVPDFLLPYLKEQSHTSPHTDALTAFSTAETGPLPVIRSVSRHRFSPMNQFAIIGLAAAFLMLLMTGGLTSLLLLANHGTQSPSVPESNIASIVKPAQVAMATYATQTDFAHPVSAVANSNYIYYTAYGDGSTGWMLEQLDTQTKASTPLLATSSTNPLIVLGSSQHWLFWLQLDPSRPAEDTGALHHKVQDLIRTWTLYALPVSPDQAVVGAGQVTGAPTGVEVISSLPEPITVLSGTFDESAVPSWVHTPIQGVSFVQDGALIAMVDEKGDAHLVEWQPGTDKNFVTTDIATATDGHIITSPTANSDGTSIYWSEEWFTDDNTPHSDIWTQQTTDAAPSSGRWIPHTVTSTYLFRANETSFRPQVVGDTLFFLSTGTDTGASDATSAVQATPSVTATATVQPTLTPTPAATPDTGTPVIARSDPAIYVTQPDESIRGTLLGFSINTGTPVTIPEDNGPVAAPQGGTRFLIWQSSDKGIEMYDVQARRNVTVGDSTIPRDATFLAVNGDTAVWITGSPTPPANQSDPTVTGTTVTFNMFNWPLTPQSNS